MSKPTKHIVTLSAEVLAKIAELKPRFDKSGSFPEWKCDDIVIPADVPITVQGDWIAFSICESDPLLSYHCGYFARGIVHDPKKGWLLWTFEEDDRLAELMNKTGAMFLEQVSDRAENKLHREAIAAWKEGRELPKNYYSLDAVAAVKGYIAMIATGREGFNWYGSGGDDADTYQNAWQFGLFGELVYG